MARPAASSRSTRKRSTISTLRPQRRPASRWSRNTPRRRACCARDERRSRSSPTRSNSISATVVPSLAGPEAARRTASRCETVAAGFAAALGTRIQEGRRGRPTRYAVEGAELRPRPWRRRDRRDHLLHQHLQPERDDRRGPAGAQRASSKGLKVKPWVKTSLAPGSQVVARISRQGRPAEVARQARLQSRRLWLHHLHRQFRPAAGADRRRRSTPMTSSPPPCCRATAISKAASIPTCRRIISPRRRWWWLMRSPARCEVDLTREPLGIDKKGQPVYPARHLADQRGDRGGHRARTSRETMFKARYADVFKGDAHWRKIKAPQGRDLRAGTRTRPMCRTRPISRA